MTVKRRARKMQRPDVGELWCEKHKTTHPSSKFNGREDARRAQKGVSVWVWNRNCDQALQELRIATKHENPALHVVQTRAKQIVREANKNMPTAERITTEWVMSPLGLNYESMVWQVQAYLDYYDWATCQNCGDLFAIHDDETPKCDSARFTFDHIEPPRGPRDWPRLHARNLTPRDHECNCSKSDEPFSDHLETEWQKTRIRAEAEAATGPSEPDYTRPDDRFETCVTPSLFA